MENQTTENNKATPAAKAKPPKLTVEQIGTIHAALKTAKFEVGKDAENKEIGIATKQAIRFFQAATGLKINGTLNKLTLNKLGVK